LLQVGRDGTAIGCGSLSAAASADEESQAKVLSSTF